MSDATPETPTFLRPASPYDLQLYEPGLSAAAILSKLTDAESGTLLSSHPNVHAVRGEAAFGEWLATALGGLKNSRGRAGGSAPSSSAWAA